MKKGTGIIIITAVFALLLCAGCAGQEDSAIEVTAYVMNPDGTMTLTAQMLSTDLKIIRQSLYGHAEMSRLAARQYMRCHSFSGHIHG